MFKDITIDLTNTNCYSDKTASRIAQSLVSPQRFINRDDSMDLKTFLAMIGEHFDLIRNYIDHQNL